MSDWAGIKKAINSDLSTPLNHLIWLNDYKTFGEESYVFQNKDILHELCMDYALSANDPVINGVALEDVILSDREVGIFFTKIYNIEATDTLKSLSTINAIVNSEVAMNAIVNSKVAMSAIVGSTTAMNAALNSTTAMTAVESSSKAAFMFALRLSGLEIADYADMNAVANSPTAIVSIAKNTAKWTKEIKKRFFTELNNSPSLISSVYATLTNTTYFTSKGSSAQDSVSALDSYGTASYAANGLIACFLGSYSGGSGATTNLFIDGKQVASKASSIKPTSIASATVNAIACPTATFTETGDGQAAIMVYIAN